MKHGRALRLAVVAGCVAASVSCADLSAPRAIRIAGVLFDVVCPDDHSSCEELDYYDWENIQERLSDIENEGASDNCDFIRETIEDFQNDNPRRLSKGNIGGFTAYWQRNGDDTEVIILNESIMLDEYELKWSLVHEPRHSRGEGHSLDPDGYFDAETDFLEEGCDDFQVS